MKLNPDNKNPLISAENLSSLLNDENLVLLDATKQKAVASAPEIFSKGHIPNAQQFDFANAFTDKSNPLPNSMPDPEQFTRSAQALGINQNSIIVIYDARGMYSSPRAWWMFKCMGHNDVYLLNGGLQAWVQSGKTLSDTLHSSQNCGNFQARFDSDKVYNAQNTLNSIAAQNKKIIDARGHKRFYGQVPEPREGLRSGHIPSSVNIPFTTLLNNGCLINDNKLKKIFTEKNIHSHDKLIGSCGSGLTACIVLLAAYKMGHRDLAVYDGSWTEWGMDHKLPINLED